MKLFFLFFLSLFFVTIIQSQDRDMEPYLIDKELNPVSYLEARNAAVQQNLPVSIKMSEGILIDVLKIHDGTLVYSVIKNAAHPLDGFEVLTFEQVSARFDLTNAEINYGTPGNEIYYPDAFAATKLLLVPDWTADNVLSFDPQTGDLINSNYIPSSPGNLASPKQARINTGGFVTVSDQITDLVQKYDTLGAYLGLLAPAGGVNTALLDNIRGHNYRDNGNLIVCVGSGGNQNSVAEFDPAGNYIGQFITTALGGLNSPFDILIRANDLMVTGSSSDAAHRYTLTGTYISDFVTGIQFPQQIVQLSGGRVAIAIFSSPSGLGIYDSSGTQISFFTAVTGLRGVYQLGSGNYLVSNGTGVHEISSTDGSLIRTVVASSNCQYINLADYAIIPVELTSFTASASENIVTLNWSTATETNNSGFAIERSYSGSAFEQISFVEGFGTTASSHNYTYSDRNLLTGKYSYRLKQIDYDGTISYSEILNTEVGMPGRFALEQNYPNPFNPSTTISYSVPFDADVTIEVFNLLGQKVQTLMNDFKKAGRYQLTFDASGLSSGTYLYKLSSGDYSSIRKMTLVK
jgi:hypothetical protein